MTQVDATRAQRYHRWTGQLSRGRWTWLAIVVTGVRLTLKNTRTRGLIMTGLGSSVLAGCGVFYVLSLLETLVGTPEAAGIYDFVRVLLGVNISGVARLEEYRELLWRTVFLVIIKVQLIWVLLVVARVGPGLIANDLKTRALPVYFSKPVTPATYLAGKWMIVAAFVAMVTLVPNLLSLILGVLITGGLETWGSVLHLGCDLLVSGLGICLVAGTIALVFSSLTSDHRAAAGAWLAFCLLLTLAQRVVDAAVPKAANQGLLACISLRDDVVVLVEWLFGLREAWAMSALPTESFSAALVKPVPPLHAGLVVLAWVLGALVVCYRRVIRFSRSAANL